MNIHDFDYLFGIALESGYPGLSQLSVARTTGKKLGRVSRQASSLIVQSCLISPFKIIFEDGQISRGLGRV